MAVRTTVSACSNGKIHVFRNTFEKCGGSGGDCVNSKGGTVGTVAYNFFIGTAYNGQKASNKGQPVGAPQTNIVMYNSTFVNGGTQITAGTRAGGIDYEQGAEGGFFNNVFINCTRRLPRRQQPCGRYRAPHIWQQLSVGRLPGDRRRVLYLGRCVHQTDAHRYPQSFARTCRPNFYYPNPPQNAYDGTPVVQYENPKFLNYPLPVTRSSRSLPIRPSRTSISDLTPGSPLIGKGNTNITPLDRSAHRSDLRCHRSHSSRRGPGCYQIRWNKGNPHYRQLKNLVYKSTPGRGCFYFIRYRTTLRASLLAEKDIAADRLQVDRLASCAIQLRIHRPAYPPACSAHCSSPDRNSNTWCP